MSFNTPKQRKHLYSLTFLKWTVERRLSELEGSSIESSLAVHKFGNDANNVNFNKLAESLSDLETMLEVAELSFPHLRFKIDKIKKQKLTVLKKQTTISNEADKLEGKIVKLKTKASSLTSVIDKQKSEPIKSKGLKGLLGM